VVMPVLNQRRYIEAAIRSVICQAYPNLEYIVVDGGSTDGTVDIIRRYEPWISHWVSEPDRGMYDALNKGFSTATGDVMAWLNGDDMYAPWAFGVVGEVFRTFAGTVEWITGLPAVWATDNSMCGVKPAGVYFRHCVRWGLHEGRILGFIQQESTFWSRDLWRRAGARLDDSLRLAADFDLWRRFAEHAPLYVVQTVLGGFRRHPDQQTARLMREYLCEVDSLVGGQPIHTLATLLPGFAKRVLRGFARSEPLGFLGHRIVYRSEKARWVTR